MIKIHSFVFSPFMENTYLVWDESTKDAAIIDPGCYDQREKETMDRFINENELNVTKLLNTHCHIDHVFGNQYVKDTYGVELYIHKSDHETLRAVKAYAPSYGFVHFEESEPDHFLEEGDQVTIGETNFDVLFVPGHAPGHIAFSQPDMKVVIGGDVLFRESIGRTDLPGGDMETLLQSIRTKFFTLNPDTVVHCGHGESTTIAHEMKHNPFCKLS